MVMGGIYMVFFAVIVKVLVFALCVGAIVSVLVCVPQLIYVIPYAWHCGSTVTGEPDPTNLTEWRQAAHKYYKSKRAAKAREPKPKD